MWIDTHAHLDAAELAQFSRPNRPPAQAKSAPIAIKTIATVVIPAVEMSNFDAVRTLAHAHAGDAYALGIHPLYVARASDDDLMALDEALTQHCGDPRLVAVGEIGLDYFVPELARKPLRGKQERFYRAQLKLAKKHGLPVILHVRKSADQLLKGLRDFDFAHGGIAHAFNGSDQQAAQFIERGFCLGFGGAVTFERALQLRHLVTALPLEAIVMETDSPDIPPHWLYVTAEQRARGVPQGVNSPMELPRIGAVVAGLRGITPEQLAQATSANARRVLPKLGALWSAVA
jgi:TatD DNase family protein